ncbi:hypothetical protein [Megavirus chiliensis]|uniref:Uncharacterized protein n=3 Tax=Megamimivirinae TaxID=3044648 RepID=A0A2L2DL73_MIMIV|nr:hypothetical protein MegaChil _gp0059 [Megavirus chiliensis]AEQ32994.1 hypothetical protein [Megavirus chiliensis]AVG46900.1 hypothetical protein [Acanthamoeba polyphaga mimivirus]
MSRSIYQYSCDKLFDLLKKSNVSDNYNDIVSFVNSCPLCLYSSNILNYTPLMIICDTSQQIFRRLDIVKFFWNYIPNIRIKNDHCALLAINNMNNPDCVHVLDLLLKNGIGKNNTQLFLRWYQKGGKYKNDIMQLLLKYCPIQILVLGFYETNSYNKNIAKKLFQSKKSSKTYSKKLLNVTIQNIVYGDSTKNDFYVWMLSMLLNYGFVIMNDPEKYIDKVNNIRSKDYINDSRSIGLKGCKDDLGSVGLKGCKDDLGSIGLKGCKDDLGSVGLKGCKDDPEFKISINDQETVESKIQYISASTYKDLILNLIENLNINDLSSECKKYINIIPEKYRTNITNIILQILRAKSYYRLNFIKQEIHDLQQQIIYSPNSLRTRLAAIQWYISIGNIDKIITIPNLELLEELGIREFILDDISKCIGEALKFA